MTAGTRLAGRDSVVATALLIGLIWAGSRGGRDLDPALGGYLGATIVAAAGLTFRLSAFWRRPASAVYARALRDALRHPRGALAVLRSGADDLVAQRFVHRRSRVRGLAHLLLSLGTLTSFAITLPLVFGWMRFEAIDQTTYSPIVFGLRTGAFDLGGPVAWLTFHALSLAGLAVVVGSVALLWTRSRQHSTHTAMAARHVAPLVLLLAVAISGLALPATRALPAAFDVASTVHEILVVTMLIAMSTSKLSHVLIRPLQLGARVMRAAAAPRSNCLNCGAELAPSAQILAVEQILAARGGRFGSHQRRCAACRRRQLATAQSRLMEAGFQPRVVDARPRPRRKAA